MLSARSILASALLAAALAPSAAQAATTPPAKAFVVPCHTTDGWQYLTKPTSCGYYDQYAQDQTPWTVTSIKWKLWGKKTAKATGNFAFEGGYNGPVTITAGSLVKCGSRSLYSHIKVEIPKQGPMFDLKGIPCPAA